MLFPDSLLPFVKAAKKIYAHNLKSRENLNTPFMPEKANSSGNKGPTYSFSNPKENNFEVIFSGPTYQILCAPDAWVFVQFNQHDEIKDIFCQCDSCSEKNACVHMALALIIIFGDSHSLPLHKRFEKSPFFSCFSFLSKRISFHEVKNNAHLEIQSKTEHVTISGPPAWRKKLCKELLCQDETEENSIKFSDLSDEEIDAWRKGVFSDRLKFELSPCAGIAKALFVLSEKEKCSYTLSWEQEHPEITFSCLDISCTAPIISKEHLISMLETLPTTLVTPSVKSIDGHARFDKENKKITVIFHKKEAFSTGIPITNDWKYFPGEGFIKNAPKKRSLALTSSDDISFFLDTHGLDSNMLSFPISHTLHELQYSIDVNERTGISIDPFLKQPGDLNEGLFFGSWCWTQDMGFFKVSPFHFPQKFIPKNEIDEFLAHHRQALLSLLGITVHDHSAKQQITFQVDETGALSFSSRPIETSSKKCVNIGSWVFIEKEGFFLQEGNSFFPESIILPHHVARFIRQHIDILHEIPGFFTETIPVHDVELCISYVKKKISISSKYHWTNPEYEKKAFFYDDFGYIPNLGFFQIPNALAQQHINRSISPKEKEVWDAFFLEQLPRLKKEFHCTIEKCLEPPLSLSLVCQSISKPVDMPNIRLEGIWDASFIWKSEKGTVLCTDLLKSYLNGDRFHVSPAGLIDLSDDRFGWFTAVPLSKHKELQRLQSTDILKIRAHGEFSFDDSISSYTASFIKKLLESESTKPLPDLPMYTTLRSYQKKGLAWLWYLYTNSLSGLLCDDMGVGKTHQAIALLGAVWESMRQEGKTARFLVLCPTSLFWHWKEKIEATLPLLSVFPYTGTARSTLEFSEKHTIFLTTYGIFRNEIAELKKIQFEIAIFDELQIAKNHVSLIWSALSQVKAPMYLGLTGTPVENNVRELKAIFDLILPGYLPKGQSSKDFGSQKKDLLSKYVRPFVLRRRKQDVLLDLPPKTEEVYTTSLIGEQKTLYKQVAARQSSSIIQQLQDESAPIPYMHIFALLSALKQICNHPATYLRDVENYQRYESGKWDAFVELLEEAHESGQKIIVFSHYLAMLDVIAMHLYAKKISFAEIRGNTKNRGEVIEKFQKDPKCMVFLGSLHAAGLGIDLTAGSVVIHYDRWWNAAREDQATDRAHRIGQTRGVMVYKFLTTETVEERIDELISKKARLFEDLIKFDDHRIVKQFSRQELLHLLREG